MAVLDGVVVDVIGVAGQIGFIANLVFPIPALPDAALAFDFAAGANRFSGRDGA